MNIYQNKNGWSGMTSSLEPKLFNIHEWNMLEHYPIGLSISFIEKYEREPGDKYSLAYMTLAEWRKLYNEYMENIELENIL